MATKIFTDTNIIIDLIEQRPFELDAIHEIVSLTESGEIEMYISETVITNALYITKLTTHVERVLDFSNVIFIGNQTINTALKSSFSDKEDAILYYGALHAKADYFITRNKKDFINYSFAQLPVMGAKEFLKKLKG